MSSSLSGNSSEMSDLGEEGAAAGSDEGWQVLESEWVVGMVAVQKWLRAVLLHDVCASIPLLKLK